MKMGMSSAVVLLISSSSDLYRERNRGVRKRGERWERAVAEKYIKEKERGERTEKGNHRLIKQCISIL